MGFVLNFALEVGSREKRAHLKKPGGYGQKISEDYMYGFFKWETP